MVLDFSVWTTGLIFFGLHVCSEDNGLRSRFEAGGGGGGWEWVVRWGLAYSVLAKPVRYVGYFFSLCFASYFRISSSRISIFFSGSWGLSFHSPSEVSPPFNWWSFAFRFWRCSAVTWWPPWWLAPACYSASAQLFFCLSNRLALRFSSSGFGYYCIFFYFFSIFQLCCNYFFDMKVFYNFFNWIQPTSPPHHLPQVCLL